MIKLIAIDLDGTLFSSFGTISDYAINILRKARQQGVLVVISTGRPLYSVQNIIPQDCYDYASCQNGQEIFQAENQQTVYQPTLTEEEKMYLLSYLPKYKMMSHCSYPDANGYYAHIRQQKFVHFFQFASALYHKILRHPYYFQEVSYDLERLKDIPLAKLCFCGYPWSLQKFIHAIDAKKFSCFFVNHSWLEITHLGVTKGSAITKIMKWENLDMNDCVAFGDGENDLSLFAACGTKIAMANAMPSLKKVATDIAKPNTQDGCAHWIKDHLLTK